MSEQAVHEGIQAVIRQIAAFAAADVVINDWSVLDQSSQAAPYVIISNADDFRSRQDATSPQTTWQVPVAIYERWTDWPTTLANLRARRQAIIDEFNVVSDNRAANGLPAVTIDEIRNDGPITPYYGPYIRAEEVPDALPQFLMQTLILSVEEY